MNANNMSSWSTLLLLLVPLLATGQQDLEDIVNQIPCNTYLFRLSTRFWPVHYKIDLRLDPEDEKFSGEVEIELQVATNFDWMHSLPERTFHGKVPLEIHGPKKIILNAENLVIRKVTFRQQIYVEQVKSILYDANNKIMVLTLDEEVKPGYATLFFKFEGQVETEAKGLFSSSINSNQPMLATYLKPNYARRLFPCFDEPEFKATFQLTINHPKKTIALSNMKPCEYGELSNGFIMTKFKFTPRMSTYLLSLAVGEFELIKKTDTDIKIYAPKNSVNGYMFDKALEAYGKVANYFVKLSPPLEKIDIVAVNMEHSAVEGWGLITMRWDLLSVHPQRSKPNDWIHAVTVLMRQMVHQWLANRVTISWWDDLWLQEGLAAHLASELTAELPDIDSELYVLVDTTFSTMNAEDLKEHRLASKKLKKKAEDIVAGYDSITYKKSEAVLRMFADFLGKENFQSAILEFVRSNSEQGLAGPDDWWEILSREAPKIDDMKNLALKWTEQEGYPTISVELRDRRILSVIQHPNLANSRGAWSVPIRYEIYGAPVEGGVYKKEFVLSSLEGTTKLPSWFDITNENQCLKFNANYRGYYRVQYSPLLMRALNRPMITGQMRAADRMQLLSDYFSDAKKTHSTEKLALILGFLSEDIDDGVVLMLTRILTELHDKKSFLGLISLATDQILKYHDKNGGIAKEDSKNALKQYTRRQVVDFLVNKLQDSSIKNEMRYFMMSTGQLPPFLHQIVGNLPR